MNDKPPATQAADPALQALRAEIDALDDAMHDLLMRRAGVVARMAASRAKVGAGSPLRPGREAAVLRRLLARHSGALS
ncbi:MAG: chorismate mutase, partial [Alphaproteobacteria bacterium]